METSKRAVCFLLAKRASNSGKYSMSTAWVVRNDAHIAALVTALHVVKHHIGELGTLDQTEEATFADGQQMDLSGARVLEAPVRDEV